MPNYKVTFTRSKEYSTIVFAENEKEARARIEHPEEFPHLKPTYEVATGKTSMSWFDIEEIEMPQFTMARLEEAFQEAIKELTVTEGFCNGRQTYTYNIVNGGVMFRKMLLLLGYSEDQFSNKFLGV